MSARGGAAKRTKPPHFVKNSFEAAEREQRRAVPCGAARASKKVERTRRRLRIVHGLPRIGPTSAAKGHGTRHPRPRKRNSAHDPQTPHSRPRARPRPPRPPFANSVLGGTCTTSCSASIPKGGMPPVGEQNSKLVGVGHCQPCPDEPRPQQPPPAGTALNTWIGVRPGVPKRFDLRHLGGNSAIRNVPLGDFTYRGVRRYRSGRGWALVRFQGAAFGNERQRSAQIADTRQTNRGPPLRFRAHPPELTRAWLVNRWADDQHPRTIRTAPRSPGRSRSTPAQRPGGGGKTVGRTRPDHRRARGTHRRQPTPAAPPARAAGPAPIGTGTAGPSRREPARHTEQGRFAARREGGRGPCWDSRGFHRHARKRTSASPRPGRPLPRETRSNGQEAAVQMNAGPPGEARKQRRTWLRFGGLLTPRPLALGFRFLRPGRLR